MGANTKSGYNPEQDELESGPPVPPLRDAQQSPSQQPSAFHRSLSGGGDGDGGTRSLALFGAGPVAEVSNAMATIEQQIKHMARIIPGFNSIAAPFIAQMRDMGGAALADLAQGGTGSVDSGAGAPPPGMPPMGAPGGGAGAPGGMMPPPLPMG